MYVDIYSDIFVIFYLITQNHAIYRKIELSPEKLHLLKFYMKWNCGDEE